jgi:catechol 2,3-dioxygenase-like lactoylglutathione lyase family enzyme
MQMKVIDLDESIEFYSNVLGMVQTGRDATRAYFKGWDERDHNSLILRDAGEAGMDFFGFKVLDDATLKEVLENKFPVFKKTAVLRFDFDRLHAEPASGPCLNESGIIALAA